MKQFKGKSIYEARGKASEYSKYAASFYVGCYFGCHYCFNKKGRFANVLGGDTPTLKSCFKDEAHALEVFEKELQQNLPELQEYGLFFSFTTDPMLPETKMETTRAIIICIENGVPCKILTKCTDWCNYVDMWFVGCKNRDFLCSEWKKYIAFGFTLTGHDELEPNASTNTERIEAMRKLHDAGFKTWASIEPIIDFVSSAEMMRRTVDFCDLYKVGLMSCKKYDKWEVEKFVSYCIGSLADKDDNVKKIYFKDSLLERAGIERSDLPNNCITRDYNIFTNK